MPTISRQIKTILWKDKYFRSLNPEEKIVFMYYLLNEELTASGVYELGREKLADDTGLTIHKIKRIEKKFTEDKKVIRFNGWVWIVNRVKHLRSSKNKISHTVKAGIRNQLSKVPMEKLEGLGILKDKEFMEFLDLKVTGSKLGEAGKDIMAAQDLEVLRVVDMIKGYLDIESDLTQSDKTYSKRLITAFEGDKVKVEALCRLVKFYEQSDYPYVIQSVRALYEKKDKIIARWKRDDLRRQQKAPAVAEIK